jgi:hypothetical protein
VLLAPTSAVTDVLMTVLNSTGYMTAAVLVRRFAPHADSSSMMSRDVGRAQPEKPGGVVV